MPSHQEPAGFPKCGEFRALSSGYSRFRWYSIAVWDHPKEVIVTLARTSWRQALTQALCFAAVFSAFITLAWLIKPGPVEYGGVLKLGAVMCLWPLYVPLLRLLVLHRRLPFIRFDKALGVVHLLGESRHVAISDVIAICDVIVPGKEDSGGDYVDQVCELQLLLKTPAGREFLLLSGSWHHSAEQALGPIAGNIAARLGIPHLSVNSLRGTIVEQRVVQGPKPGPSSRLGAADNSTADRARQPG